MQVAERNSIDLKIAVLENRRRTQWQRRRRGAKDERRKRRIMVDMGGAKGMVVKMEGAKEQDDRKVKMTRKSGGEIVCAHHRPKTHVS